MTVLEVVADGDQGRVGRGGVGEVRGQVGDCFHRQGPNAGVGCADPGSWQVCRFGQVEVELVTGEPGGSDHGQRGGGVCAGLGQSSQGDVDLFDGDGVGGGAQVGLDGSRGGSRHRDPLAGAPAALLFAAATGQKGDHAGGKHGADACPN